MKNNNQFSGFEIAIVGMSCRFPDACNWREYWSNLVNGKESIHFLSNQELLDLGVDERTIRKPDFVNARTILKDKCMFDAVFFDYRPGEAALMNPMHRIFHECVWEALEDAAYDPERTKGLISLYAGGGDDLNWKVYSMLKNRNQDTDDFTLRFLNNKDYIASLVSYKLNLNGPSFSVNTACSTSLVAINLACKSLLLGETNLALAGGVSVMTNKQKGYFHREGGISSADGHCRAFDKDASGTTGGEGAGIVVLRRLSDAINDGDHIYSIIKGGAINNDGNRKVGFTAPSVEGQVDCIRRAHKFAKVEPETITYVETHGTGTRLGDPIEVEALNIAFNNNREHTCAIGSVKTNIGHLDTAAGIAGLIKTALSLKYKLIPKSLHFKTPNPEIDFAGGPFYVNSQLKKWENNAYSALRAGVSSFGIGGTNAHTILEEAPEQENADVGRKYKLLTISAKTESSLIRFADRLQDFLRKEEHLNLADLAYTLQVGRKQFPYRNSVTYKDKEDLLNILDSGKLKESIIKSSERSNSVVFMFPGQGSQYVDMGKDLYLSESLFREEMDMGFSIIEDLTGENYRDILFSATKDFNKINQTKYTQPIVFLLEFSLCRLMMSLGVKPDRMIGHSIGEYVAACIGGVFSFKDALTLVVRRGELMNDLPAGAMLSVPIAKEQASEFLNEHIFLAAVNGPEQVVFSGDRAAIDGLRERLELLNLPYTTLLTSHAFHSGMQDPILDNFRSYLEKVTFNKIEIPFLSNLTGSIINDNEARSVDYWLRHLRETVKFSEGIKSMLSESRELLFIEVGAGHTLTSLLKQHSTSKFKPIALNLIQSAKETIDDLEYLTVRIGQLWSYGINIDWTAYFHGERRCRISLPTYAFEPNRFPAEVDSIGSGSDLTFNSANQFFKRELKDRIYYHIWKSSVAPEPPTTTSPRSFIYFSTGSNLANSLKSRVRKDNIELVEIRIDEKYERESKYQYCIDPANSDHLKRLIEDVKNDLINITDIIYDWSQSAVASKHRMLAEEKDVNLVYFCLLNVVQGFCSIDSSSVKRVSILTHSLHVVSGHEESSYLQSLILRVAEVLPKRFHVICRNIDFHQRDESENLIDKLYEEINCMDSLDTIVAFRHGQRWLPDYQINASPIHANRRAIKIGGVYLITAGLGNVGFTLAKHLIDEYQVKVILTGMSDINGENSVEWRNRLEELEGLSKHVFFFNVDISDLEKFTNVIAEIKNTIGSIDGVIHAPGSTAINGEIIKEMPSKRAYQIFSGNVNGIVNIYKVFGEDNLDFVLTVLNHVPDQNLGINSASNSFIKGFVSSKSAAHPSWKLFDLFENVASDAVSVGQDKMEMELKSDEIITLFEWMVPLRNNILVLQSKPGARADWPDMHPKSESEPKNESEADTGKSERPSLSSPYQAPETDTEKKMIGMTEGFFGIEKIGTADDFFELGGDSLKAMVLLNRIKKEFNIDFPMKIFFKSPNIKQTAIEIDRMLWINRNSKKRFVSNI